VPPRTRRPPKRRPDAPDLPPRLDPAPDAVEAGAFLDGVAVGPGIAVPEHVPDLRCHETRWTGVDLSGRRFTGLHVRDTEFVQCDLSGATLDDAVLTRVTFTDCRLTGIGLAGAELADVVISAGHADLAGLRMARARYLLVEDTSCRGADLYRFTGADCAFLRCDLAEAAFDEARLERVRMHGSRLDDVRGALSLRGAQIGPDQVVTLGAALLGAVGIAVTD
jgi:uncharacterized protein YjbI with pentapeptide repeats